MQKRLSIFNRYLGFGIGWCKINFTVSAPHYENEIDNVVLVTFLAFLTWVDWRDYATNYLLMNKIYQQIINPVFFNSVDSSVKTPIQKHEHFNSGALKFTVLVSFLSVRLFVGFSRALQSVLFFILLLHVNTKGLWSLTSDLPAFVMLVTCLCWLSSGSTLLTQHVTSEM